MCLTCVHTITRYLRFWCPRYY